MDHYLKHELYDLVQRDPAIFEFLQAGSLDGIWYWDLTDPGVEWMSPRFWQVFGYNPATKPHRADAWQDMIHPDDLALALDNFNKHCTDPDHPYDQLVRYRHKDGSMVWVRCRGLAIRDADGTPIRMLGAHTEVTALKETEAELESKNLALEQANAELKQFAYAATHDLRNPLNSLTALLERLDKQRDALDATGQHMLTLATDMAHRMQSLMDGISQYSRLTNQAVAFAPVDLGELVQHVVDDLGSLISRHEAVITWDALPTVRAHTAGLQQLFQNLMANAIKFTPPERTPRVRITAERTGRSWTVSVSDNGIGIGPEHHTRIFDLFTRLNNASEYDGSGLGLALCRRIVQQHGGRIWLTSTPGEGTTFFFTLPTTL
ncbi:MAG: ATP-binding protein [Bacteroidota bacterium]